jgi:hypothetical protein
VERFRRLSEAARAIDGIEDAELVEGESHLL